MRQVNGPGLHETHLAWSVTKRLHERTNFPGLRSSGRDFAFTLRQPIGTRGVKRWCNVWNHRGCFSVFVRTSHQLPTTRTTYGVLLGPPYFLTVASSNLTSPKPKPEPFFYFTFFFEVYCSLMTQQPPLRSSDLSQSSAVAFSEPRTSPALLRDTAIHQHVESDNPSSTSDNLCGRPPRLSGCLGYATTPRLRCVSPPPPPPPIMVSDDQSDGSSRSEIGHGVGEVVASVIDHRRQLSQYALVAKFQDVSFSEYCENIASALKKQLDATTADDVQKADHPADESFLPRPPKDPLDPWLLPQHQAILRTITVVAWMRALPFVFFGAELYTSADVVVLFSKLREWATDVTRTLRSASTTPCRILSPATSTKDAPPSERLVQAMEELHSRGADPVVVADEMIAVALCTILSYPSWRVGSRRCREFTATIGPPTQS